MIAIDADRVGARLRPRQRILLEGLGLGIEVADLAAAPLGEPDGAVGIDLQALRLALGRRIELRQHAVLGDPRDRSVLDERGEPLVAVLPDLVAVGAAEVVMREPLVFRIEHRDRRAAARPDAPGLVDADRMRRGAPPVRQRRVLVFGHLSGARIELADAARPQPR